MLDPAGTNVLHDAVRHYADLLGEMNQCQLELKELQSKIETLSMDLDDAHKMCLEQFELQGSEPQAVQLFNGGPVVVYIPCDDDAPARLLMTTPHQSTQGVSP